jgi:hypothetical protein
MGGYYRLKSGAKRRIGQPRWRWDHDNIVVRHWITGVGNRVAGNSGSGLGHNFWRPIDERVWQRIQQSGLDSSGFDPSGFDPADLGSSSFNQPRGPAGTGHNAGRGGPVAHSRATGTDWFLASWCRSVGQLYARIQAVQPACTRNHSRRRGHPADQARNEPRRRRHCGNRCETR